MFALKARWDRLLAVLLVLLVNEVNSELLTPPYFNLAEGRKIYATATCGVDTDGPELYCKLVGSTTPENDFDFELIKGQQCDVCDPSRPEKRHPPEFAVDGMETWWQSPPLSRGMKYNEVNLTIDLGQEFHVAYVYVKMGNSPRPGLWILEKSVDYGKSYTPWQYFSDSIGDCIEYFGEESIHPISKDDSVICNTDHSRIVPLEGGEIPISLLNNRPSANHYFNSSVLQEWTRATNVRLRLLRTKNLFGHLMSVAKQDPTVTRRYFYSIKDISIGGRCMCNGHADTCDNRDPNDPSILVCLCRHNTCGLKCDKCCPGFEQKAWRQSKSSAPFSCEPCNCFNHSNECIYDEEVDKNKESLDIHGRYEGGGVCQNCQHNTEGINCNKCKSRFYRPFKKHLNETDVCQPCDCDKFYSTGNCAEGTGQCECKKEYLAPNCDACSFGYYGYPECKPCDCFLNGTMHLQCEAVDGKCACKHNFGNDDCSTCAEDYYNFPTCEPCECNPLGSLSSDCQLVSGNCSCKNNYGGKQCDQCQDGYFNYPSCPYCNCDVKGTEAEICDKQSGKCVCREGYGGERCDQCIPGYYGYPDCKPCNCSTAGSISTVCDMSGKCTCLSNFAGRTCGQCSPGNYKFPECLSCNCDSHGAIGVSCNEGICQCHHNFDGERCERCKEGFYNFPACEDCNCNPAGVIAEFAGCGSVPKGELCQCKERVEGRICDKCKPLYWNLNTQNPDGCEECSCNIPGVLGGITVCDSEDGQCTCKPNVVARGCTDCSDGTYNLLEDNLFGCTDCGCDVGGSTSSVCDKLSGQCTCQPRVTGRTCKEPLQMHFFPTLYQYQYEVEDGKTLDSDVRYLYNETDFPNYSWKGYAVFSVIQREIFQDIYIYKPSIYRMVLRYVNKNPDTSIGTIKIVPDNPSDIEQKYPIEFKNSTKPGFVTLTGNGAPLALVMNPGKWTVHIIAEKNILLDYFVLLPEEFYTASILNQRVEDPCIIDKKGLCREFSYPNITNYDTSLGSGAYVDLGAQTVAPITEYYENFNHLNQLGVANRIPFINDQQNELSYNITLTKSGRYVILVNYITPINDQRTHTLNVSLQSNNDIGQYTKHKIVLYNCPYTTVCRQIVTTEDGIVSVYNADENVINFKLKGVDANVGIQSIVAIPYDEWSFNYIQPRPICIRKGDTCVQSTFPNPPESKKIQFEKEAISEEQIIPIEIIANASYIHLNPNENIVDIRSKVPTPGLYSFIVHFYQPDHPEYNLDVIIQNGLFYEAKLPVRHCPSKTGCRALVSQKDGVSRFSLTENFMITFQLPKNKDIFLDYLYVIPHDLYNLRYLEEDDLDRTGEFISTCGSNHFYINTTEEGFCRDAVFSITAGYNNGALPCQCDYDGSLSFQCDKFGGQCQCRENVIGRQCSACKTGYYGFPDCKPCNCPSNSNCEPSTGQCICPNHVIGEQCDQCQPLTYGYDQFNGCNECKCNPLGVERSLQCDIINGSCPCKDHIVGRKCDACEPGYFAFPYCEPCECELRGTTDEICDQQTAECFCKKFVTGPACDICMDGTFDLQETSDVGCTECFCFGKTTRCYSSSLLKSYIYNMEDWDAVVVNATDGFEVMNLNLTMHRVGDHSFGIDIGDDDYKNNTIYFATPASYLGKRLTAYGGYLNYTLFYTLGEVSGKSLMRPDVILQGSNNYLMFNSVEQPAAAQDFQQSLSIVESNFVLPNGLPAKREHLMTVLKDINGIYIRGTYSTATKTSRLSNVVLNDAVRFINDTYYYELATSIEQCDCPPNYRGLSCEECSPGYYRINTGPHGGYCVPCQCNGHAQECDVNTGVCIECQHNTIGDHCEQCAIGYHGNAMQGTPKDCLICACPLPISSNNFATSCEVSGDGEKISCDCVDGYTGGRCQSCADGFYGRPEFQGDFCKPCQCNGNINPDEHGSCESVTGECLRCLNNTFGEACALCKPGFFGDAIQAKNCQSCVCDEMGTERCNSYTGECVCKTNVVGDKCDRCEVDHYGFQSGKGCQPCECSDASISLQCEDSSGQCMCQPGVTGRTCEKCAPGFWNYSSDGCLTCGCKSEYSLGFGCNALTGQCECLPGVTGDKCDHCPYRWAFVPEYGCFGCDSCTHDLLDFTDELANMTDPIINEFDAAGSGYFTTRRLAHINDTIKQLKPKVMLLSPDKVNLTPIIHELDSMEQEANNMNRKANYSVDNSKNLVKEASELRMKSLKALEKVRDAADDAANMIDDTELLATNLSDGDSVKVDAARQSADNILSLMKIYNLTDRETAAEERLFIVNDLLHDLKTYKTPVDDLSGTIKDLKIDLKEFNDKLDDLSNQTQYSLAKTAEANELYDKNGKDRLEKKLNNINIQTEETENNLKESKILLQNATKFLEKSRSSYDILKDIDDNFRTKNDNFNLSIEANFNKLDDIEQNIPNVQAHAEELSRRAEELDNLLTETRNTSENAVKAATAYNEINKAIEAAEAAADQSKEVVDATAYLLSGIEGETMESDSNSSLLLAEAHNALNQMKDLKPHMMNVISKSRPVRGLHEQNAEQLKNIEKMLENYHTKSLDNLLIGAKKNAENADVHTQNTLNELQNGFKEIGNRTDSAKELPKKLYEANGDIDQVKKQLDTVNEKLPQIIKSIKELPAKHAQGKDKKYDIETKINKLNEQIAIARDMANRIDVGVKFNPRTTLELRNPNNLPDLSTSTQISGYFKTPKPDGLIMFLGNEKGTNLRKTKTDDYMALEVVNGYPVLRLDIGNGPEEIVNPKYVADDKWYQFVIDRTGLNAKLSIKEELLNNREKEIVKEQQLDGPYSIFNLDKNQSKLFVGSHPIDFEAPMNVRQNSFDGEMEGLMIGETPISLWNFNRGYENNQGAQQRDKLRKIQATGYRFNGYGYAILNSRAHEFKTRSDVQLSFKTFASEGLIFLYGKPSSFLSLELRNGKILYSYNLGGDTKLWVTPRTYNDGEWHTIKASREGSKGRLIVDNEDIADRTKGISGSTLEADDTMFIGGFPQFHSIKDVSNTDFDGCIDELYIMSRPVDLSDNIKAYGVTPGCPVKFSRLVSFHENVPAYLKMDNVSSANDFKINLKFKTKAKDGLIFYAKDRNQDSDISLSLEDGYLKLISQKTELLSRDNNFNDNEWHVVNVRHGKNALQMDFDDYGNKVTDSAPPPLHILYGDIYIGGLPTNFALKSGVINNYAPFSGCIADATINGNLINFANATDKYGDIVGRCILDKEVGSDSDIHTVPILPPLNELDYYTTAEPEHVTDHHYDSDIPKRGDGGKDGAFDEDEEGPDTDDGGHEDGEGEIDLETTTWPQPVQRLPEISTATPPICALPMDPEFDESLLLSGSYRYGNEKDSRLEFKSPRGKYRKQFEFSLEFKTMEKNGILFYVSDPNHMHMAALFIKDGYLNFVFNGGQGPAILTSYESSIDNVWHEVQFSREGPYGKLVIDGNMVAEGKAPNPTQKIDLYPPYYLGGVAPNIFNQVLGNLNISESFKGCIRNFMMNGKTMENPELYGVIPCSEHVEPGVFFGAKGGYIRLKERFKVGLEIEVKMDIKPRNLSGLIMAVHGKKDYFVLEMDNGALKLTVENGKGPITTRYQPSEPHLFCDGQWHSIQAVKSKSVVTLAVNGVYSPPGIGDHRSGSTDTVGYLFLGGHRLISRAKGLTVRVPYVGCIKNVMVNTNTPIQITHNMVEGNINIGSCPTN